MVAAIEGELQHTAPGYRARSDEELAVILQALGDLTETEAQERSTDPLQARPWLQELAVERRIVPLRGRWVAAELAGIYRDALGDGDKETRRQGDREREAARVALVRRYLATHGPVPASSIAERYALPREWLDGALVGIGGARRSAARAVPARGG